MKSDDKQEARFRLGVILSISLGLNTTLPFATVMLRQKSAATTIPHSVNVAAVRVVTQQPSADLPAVVNYITNRFRWQMLESTNFEQYMANLRGIGCPEKTVRAIVRADVDRCYEVIKRQAQTNLPFWTGGRKLHAAQAAQQARRTALEKEESALIGHLLGVEYYGESLFNDDFDKQAIARFVFGPMPDETFQRLANVADKYEALKNDFGNRTGNLLTKADKAEARTLAGAEQRELKARLTPAEWEEFLARSGALQEVDLLSGHAKVFEVAGLSACEARRLALAREDNPLSFDLFGWNLEESDAERQLRDLQFINAVAHILGEKRFAEFQRAQDSDFVRLFNLARDNQLPRESAVKVYEMRQLAGQEVERIRHDDSLDDSAREQSFAEMQALLQQAVSQTLGVSAYRDYLRRGGNWITNVKEL
ncbi:MAG TPA: hypothetical protein VF430_08745 [Verrucomicrobiae bacterium]